MKAELKTLTELSVNNYIEMVDGKIIIDAFEVPLEFAGAFNLYGEPVSYEIEIKSQDRYEIEYKGEKVELPKQFFKGWVHYV